MAKRFMSFLLCISLTITFLFTPSSSAFTFVCDPARFDQLQLKITSFAFCDSSLPYPVRAKDLVDQMTLAEKVQQLGNKAAGVQRLGLPPYEWWSEALHGVSNTGPGVRFDNVVPGATNFPTIILTVATFNESLWKNIAEVISTEARAMYNMERAGLTFWSPTINVVRDPRWGRITETPGEDPFVVGRYAVNFVRGLQDVEGHEIHKDLNARPLKVSACCKHYNAYDIDRWRGVDRFHFDARVTEQDMLETFTPPFEMCVREGDASSVMCSYNRVNGVPTCADPKLLNQTIRGEWDLHGYIVADCDSIEVFVNKHKFLNDTSEDGVARTLKAGLDLDCGVTYPNALINATNQGKVRETDIDRALKYLYVVLMRLGYFDGSLVYKSLGKANVCTPQNIELAAEAARQGIVLLKNDDHTLPLNPANVKTLAVVGPHGNATTPMRGNYAGIPCRYTTPLDGFSSYTKVNYSIGCEDVFCKENILIPPAVETAKSASATVILVGLNLTIEAEDLDRETLLLPGFQTQLINDATQAAQGPVILVIMSAGCVDITFAKNNPKIKSILWAGFPGEEGGRAIADTVFGRNNPGGRLPITWYKADYIDKIPMTSMPLRPVGNFPGRTYKFFNGPVVYPFGYGLSYTQFKYNLAPSNRSVGIKLNRLHHCRPINYMGGIQPPPCASVLLADLPCNETFEVEMGVQNVGNMDGSEVVLVYSKPPKGIPGTHMKQVIGFQRVFVTRGQNVNVKFVFNVCKSLGIVDYAANRLLTSGRHTILVGDAGVATPVDVNLFN
ncbi:hypothetical protein Pint_10024 [Pistacia integerrima]|uniref:Uncharacterized protein n=1 Tax=Pistacia integerrima TaxID=434235 RepID=A0ACC0XFA2_9ROSI|nr:hypothetical protein Pint_10024 [Pistacia integerrima]